MLRPKRRRWVNESTHAGLRHSRVHVVESLLMIPTT